MSDSFQQPQHFPAAQISPSFHLYLNICLFFHLSLLTATFPLSTTLILSLHLTPHFTSSFARSLTVLLAFLSLSSSKCDRHIRWPDETICNTLTSLKSLYCKCKRGTSALTHSVLALSRSGSGHRGGGCCGWVQRREEGGEKEEWRLPPTCYQFVPASWPHTDRV